jgi:hypothetical protein
MVSFGSTVKVVEIILIGVGSRLDLFFGLVCHDGGVEDVV